MAALLVATTSAAHGQEPAYPGLRPSTDPALLQIVARGVQYWDDRGIDTATVCPQGISVNVAESLEGPDSTGIVAGLGGGCWIALREWSVWYVRVLLRHSHFTRLTRQVIHRTCRTAWHELGHAYGLPHFGDGLMAATPGPYVPGPCKSLARLLTHQWGVVRRARAFRKRRARSRATVTAWLTQPRR